MGQSNTKSSGLSRLCSCNSDDYQSVQQENYQSIQLISQDKWVFENFESISKKYCLMKTPIGKGSFGEVFRAQHLQTGMDRAIKVLYYIMKGQDCTQQIAKEIEILKKLNHPNIIKIYEYYQSENSTLIVTDICRGGPIIERDREKRGFTEPEIVKIMYQLFSAMYYCHQNGVIHRDLKPENILFEQPSKDSLIKIVDFGIAEFFLQNTIEIDHQIFEQNGTILYMSPERFDKKQAQTDKCDTWSLGIIMYLLLSGEHPFKGPTASESRQLIRKGKLKFKDFIFNRFSYECKSLLKKLLRVDPEKRFTCKKALEHDWFKKFNKTMLVQVDNASELIDNMRTFKADKTLEKVIWNFFANNFTDEEEKQKVFQLFQNMDKNGDGVLSKQELIQFISQNCPNLNARHEVEKIMKLCDFDGNGNIDCNEFFIATMNRPAFLNRDRIIQMFNYLDKNKDGKISFNEMRQLLQGLNCQITKEKWLQLIQNIDKNGDGEIQFEEFELMMQKFIQ